MRTIKLEERLGRRKSKKSPAIQASLRACVCARRGLPGPRRRPRALFRAAPGAAAIFDTGGKQAAPADRARQLPGTAAVVRPACGRDGPLPHPGRNNNHNKEREKNENKDKKKKKSKGNKFIAPHERRSSRQSPPTRLPASLRAVPRHPREGSRPRLPLRPAAPRPPRHEGYSGRRGHGAPPPRTRGAAAPPEGTRRGSPSPHPGARTDPSAAGRSAASLPFPGERRLLTPSGGFPEFLGGGGAPPG